MFKKNIFWFILLLGLALRLYGLYNPLLDNQAWRQADTASMAANFLDHGLLPLVPQLNYDGPAPNYVELEFPLSSLLICALWKFAGQLDWLARLVEVVFSTATLAVIYQTGKQLYDRNSGLIAMAFFACNPMAIYYGRTVMPESSMLFFMCTSLLCLLFWRKYNLQKWLLLSAVTFALAVLAKLPALMMGAPLAGIIIDKYKWQTFKAKDTWVFLIVALLPPAIYYFSAHEYAATRYVSGIIQGQLGLQTGYEYLSRKLRTMVTWALILPGLLTPFFRKTSVGNSFLWTWIGIIALYVFSVGAKIQLEYYLLPIVPLASILTGACLGNFWGEAPGTICTLLILGIMVHIGYDQLQPYYKADFRYLDQARIVQENTDQRNLLVLSDGPPMTFYYSNRKGWRLLPENQTPDKLEELRAKGAALFVILPDSKPTQQIIGYLDRHYPLVRDGDYYDLRKPLTSQP